MRPCLLPIRRTPSVSCFESLVIYWSITLMKTSLVQLLLGWSRFLIFESSETNFFFVLVGIRQVSPVARDIYAFSERLYADRMAWGVDATLFFGWKVILDDLPPKVAEFDLGSAALTTLLGPS